MKTFKLLTLLIIASLPLGALSQEKVSTKNLQTFLESQGYIPIPLSQLSTGHLYLTVELNDSTGVFILDTGAGITVLDNKHKLRFNLTSSDLDRKATGAGSNNITISESIAQSFKIGNHILNDFLIHLMSLDHVNNSFKEMGITEFDGILGADILTNGKAIIDYNNMILYLKK